MIHAIQVLQTNAFAGNDTIVAMGQAFQLNGSGGDIYRWSPPFGLSDPGISNPIVTLDQDAVYYLSVSTARDVLQQIRSILKYLKDRRFMYQLLLHPMVTGLMMYSKPFRLG